MTSSGVKFKLDSKPLKPTIAPMPNGYAKRTDDNHKQVVEEIRAALPEATVLDLSGAGKGVPDLAIGWNGKNYLIEIKDPSKPTSKRSLTTAQQKLHAAWQGQMDVAHTAAEAIAIILRNQNK